MKRAFFAGMIGGVFAVGALAVLAAYFMPRLMPRMMERTMADGNCPEAMRECMEKCGCGKAADSED